MPSGAFYRTSYGRTGTMLSLPTSNQRSSFSWFRIPLPASTEVAPGAVCWGSAGQMPTPTPLPQVGFTVQAHNEVSRVEQPVRIENPDAPDQYIMVNRADSILFNILNNNPNPKTNAYASAADDLSPGMRPAGDAVQTPGQLRVNLNNGPRSL